jgi:polyhydroxyalkanoate synthase
MPPVSPPGAVVLKAGQAEEGQAPGMVSPQTMQSEGKARRLGPRPLPYHLTVAAAIWLNSRAGLPMLSDGLQSWRPPLQGAAAGLKASLASADPEAFAQIVEAEGRRRLAALLDGIEAYRGHPYARRLTDPPTVWEEGTTRLLDYGEGGAKGPVVLIVPSLINRAYILDLTAERSLLRFLAGTGVRPLLLDWDRPGAVERGFTLTDYIAGRLESALDFAHAQAGGPVTVLGYCMGGLLALPLALRRPQEVAALACLATPWDFHAEQPARARMMASATLMLEPLFTALGELPVDLIQFLFAGIDPLSVIRKFVAFAGMDPRSAAAERFVALEDWLNDGVPLAAPVARECLAGWYAANTPANGLWRVAGRPVRPQELRCPALIVIPDHDRIVPPASALALAAAIPGGETLRPASGHIGMVVGGDAQARLWRPLAEWLHRVQR